MKKFLIAVSIFAISAVFVGLTFTFFKGNAENLAVQALLSSFNIKAKKTVLTKKSTMLFDVEIPCAFGVLKATEISFNSPLHKLLLEQKADECTLRDVCIRQTKTNLSNKKIPEFKIAKIKFETFYNDVKIIANIDNFSTSSNQPEFEIDGKILKDKKHYNFFAKKVGNILNAKISQKSREILIASVAFKNREAGTLKAKLSLSDNDIIPLPLKLEHKKTNVYTEASFDFSKRFFQTNVILQSNVSLNTTPLTLEAEAQISSNNNLKIDNLEIYARTNDIALAALKCSNKNLSNDTTNIGELTLSLPSDILNFKTNNFEISAENLSAIFDVVVSKKGDITITQKKETNVSSFAIKAVDEVLLKDLSLFAKTNATFNVIKNNYNFDVQIRTSEVAGKSLKINISSNFENNKNTIVASATGAINALLNSVNIQTKDIVSTDCNLCMQLANNVEISSLSAKIFDNTKTYLELSTPKKIIFNKQVKLFEKSASVKLLTNTSLDFNTVSAKQIESNIEFTCLNSDIFVKGNIDVKDCKYKKIFDDIFAKTSVSGAISFVTNKSLIVFNSINLSNSASAIFVGDTVLTFDSGKFESIHVNANVQIPPILKLNSFKAFNNISKGAGNITLFYVPKQKINLNAKINNLVSKDFENEISVAILDFSKDFAKNKQTTRIQTKSERGNSDLHIVSTAKNIFTIKANNIVFEDAIILKSAFTNAEKSPTEPPCCVKINRCDSRAFWIFQAPYTAHINAKSFQIDSVRLQNFTAVINASADNFSAKNIYANIDNSSVSGNLNIKFSQQNKQPYCIENSEFSVENFDTSKTSLGKILDAKISAKAVITANASDIFELLKYPIFKVSANANNGTINLLDAIHNIDTSLLQAQIKSSASNTKEKTQIEKVINAFKQIPFDKAQIEFHRDSKAFDVTIANAVFKGKDISLHCNNAKIFFDITAPFDQQKILFPITAHIHNRELSSVIETSKSTSAEFATTEKFHIFGTLENPKTNLLEVLTQQGNSAINDGIKINLFK